MPIEFRCPGCFKLLRTPDESAGKRAKCPQCGTISDVPLSSGNEGLAGPVAPLPPQETVPPPSSGSPFAETTPTKPSRPSPDLNPYASPVPVAYESSTQLPGAAQLAHRSIAVDDVLNRSFAVFKEQMGQCALMGLISVAIGMGIGMATGVFRLAAQASGEIAVIVAAVILEQLVSILVQTFIHLGQLIFSIRLARTGVAQLNDLFSAGPYYLRGLLAAILLPAMVLGVLTLCLTPGLVAILTEDPVIFGSLLAAGAVVGSPLAFYLAMRFYLVNLFIVDRNLGVIEAFRASSTFMKGNKLMTFVAMIVAGVLGSLFTCVTCFVGVILVVPFMGVFAATLYLTATGQPTYDPLWRKSI
jgi:phage FluMu protein Com